jgi:ATP-dependent Clp protease ATP-binding subunit ClpX
MQKDKKNWTCDFCGKKRDEVHKLIVGSDASICNECVSLCTNILSEEKLAKIKKEKGFDLKRLNPEIIKKTLDEHVIGQEQAKISLSVAVSQHYKKLYNPSKDLKLDKTNVMLMGPTGSGKTLLAQTIADYLNVPFAICDATTLTEAGYVGDDVESIITRLMNEAEGDVEQAERGIVFIDEVDKITKKAQNVSITRDVSGEGVQQGLLKIVEGTKVRIAASGMKRKNPQAEMVEIDTSNILFIVGGAFIGLEKIVEDRLNKGGMGFGVDIKDAEKEQDLSEVQPEDLIKFGFIPEFIGRFGLISHVNELTESQLVSIMKEPKNAIVKQYQYLFKLDGVDLELTNDAMNSIAVKAKALKTNARGIKSIMEDILLQWQYKSTSLVKKGLTGITINKDCVDEPEKALLLYKKEENGKKD